MDNHEQYQIAEDKSNFIQNIKLEVIEGEHHNQQVQTQYPIQLQQQWQQNFNEQSIPTTIFEQIDPNNIKHEAGMILSPEHLTKMSKEYLDQSSIQFTQQQQASMDDKTSNVMPLIKSEVVENENYQYIITQHQYESPQQNKVLTTPVFQFGQSNIKTESKIIEPPEQPTMASTQYIGASPMHLMQYSTQPKGLNFNHNIKSEEAVKVEPNYEEHIEQSSIYQTRQGNDHENLSTTTVLQMGLNSFKHEPELTENSTETTQNTDNISGSDTNEDSIVKSKQQEKEKTWTSEEMGLALDDVINNKMNLTKIAKKFSIPKTTLMQHARRLGSHNRKPTQNMNLDESPIHPIQQHQQKRKNWTSEDMNLALEDLRNNKLGVTKTSVKYNIPFTTLWQHARRLGIDTPENAEEITIWDKESLNNALDVLRAGEVSCSQASKTFGIPPSTLYKTARREGIQLNPSFNTLPTNWTPEDLQRALDSIRSGQITVQEANIEYGIPTGTLYSKCHRNGIRIARTNSTSWTKENMNEAVNAVNQGHMEIQQAAKHYGLPYSTLYSKIKGNKYNIARKNRNVENDKSTASKVVVKSKKKMKCTIEKNVMDNQITEHIIYNVVGQTMKNEIIENDHHDLQVHTQQQWQPQFNEQNVPATILLQITPNNMKQEPGMIIPPELLTMMTSGYLDQSSLHFIQQRSSTDNEASNIPSIRSENAENENNQHIIAQHNPQHNRISTPGFQFDQNNIRPDTTPLEIVTIGHTQNIAHPLGESPIHPNQYPANMLEESYNFIQKIIKSEEPVEVKHVQLEPVQIVHNYQMHQQNHNQNLTNATVIELGINNVKQDTEMTINSTETTKNTDIQEDSFLNSKQQQKRWTLEEMDLALDDIRNKKLGLTKASEKYNIPSTTLWQRARRLGIDTTKPTEKRTTWDKESLKNALDALRSGEISGNKASKTFGIPSSTIFKIARREGIQLTAPFNTAPTNWTLEKLQRALDSIRSGQTTVQEASIEYGIPTGTLYNRCKRSGIELARPCCPWTTETMNEALSAVKHGDMSIHQAALHYNLPYSSLYGRFKRGKYHSGETNVEADTSKASVVCVKSKKAIRSTEKKRKT